MTYIAATGEYGLVIRKIALPENGLDEAGLLKIMKDIGMMGQDDGVISFGPLFGDEALEEISRQLEAWGLEYVRDFFSLNFLTPEWVKIGVALSERRHS